jgi:hypothetical protein
MDKNSSDMEDEIFDIVTDLLRDDISKSEAIDKLLVLSNVSYWVAFDWNKPETRPTKYGKYFVHRKDGKVHWETWNGSGWAYNGNVITYWMEVKPPCL